MSAAGCACGDFGRKMKDTRAHSGAAGYALWSRHRRGRFALSAGGQGRSGLRPVLGWNEGQAGYADS